MALQVVISVEQSESTFVSRGDDGIHTHHQINAGVELLSVGNADKKLVLEASTRV